MASAPDVLVIYHSRTGNTEKMAHLVAEGVKLEGAAVEVVKAGDVDVNDLRKAKALIMGSPTYYGTMAAELKDVLDRSVEFHGDLDGKVGGAFSSSANVGGGNETTVLDILKAMLIHGMVIQGDPQGDHYGTVSIRFPDDRAASECRRLGQRVTRLMRRLG